MTARSYAMSWRVGEDGPRQAGRVEITDDALDLESTSSAAAGVEHVAYGDIVGVVLAHGMLRVDRAGRKSLSLWSIDGPGSLRELADRVAVAAHAQS